MSPKTALVILAVLLVLRAIMAAILPLSADEAYYLLWSKHLALGYYDHPPAIAFLIRAGTCIFGDNPFGVRFSGVLLSLPTTWFIWQTARIILRDERKAALAAVFFNLTLMASVELMVATPDMPSIVTVSAFLWCLAHIQQLSPRLAARYADASAASAYDWARTAPIVWWLAAGLAAGLSLLSKYSALFAGLATLVWLLADPRARAWLKTIWPWAGGAIALLVFTPHLIWQAQHDWMTFAFQFGRVGAGNPTVRYLIEFAGAQLGLASPLILALGAIGFWQARRPRHDSFLLFVMIAVALLYFLQHALRDRVQGNWPCFLYPALAILAAGAVDKARPWLVRGAAPVAAAMLALVYGQAAFGLVPIKNDPAARLLMRNFPAAAQSLAASTEVAVTTDYETTALLRYYQPQLTVIQFNDPQRYQWAQAPSASLLKKQVVYFYARRRDQTDLVRAQARFVSDPRPHGDGSYEARLIYQPAPNFPGKVP